jgi:hypothetical protein
MKKLILLTLVAGVMIGLSLIAYRGVSATEPGPDKEVIANLVREARTADISALPALPAKPYTLPAAGIEVMRVQMEETYTIAGVGTDTVQLRGWIAARHDTPRPVAGQTKVSWDTAVIDTEFVGLELKGESKIFGTVQVSLAADQPARGQVGAIDVPELRERMALARKAAPSARPDACVANIPVTVVMPQLNLSMKTESPVRMYSIVETIPPVGHTASISLTPTPLISASRTVGTLERAEVKFRETVMTAPLAGTNSQTASR